MVDSLLHIVERTVGSIGTAKAVSVLLLHSSFEIAMIDQSCKMVSMKFSPQSHDEKYYSVRQDRVFKSPGTGYFIDQKEWYEKETSTDKKQAFLVYAHAVQMVRSAFLEKKNEELKKAQTANAVEAKFEIKMVIDTLNDLLDAWEKWWNESWENSNA